MTSADVQVITLRVRGAATGSPAARLRLAHLLNGADLRPPGISPAAVLLVRRLDDPLPGRLAPKHRAARVDSRWETAVRSELEARYRQAARPRHGQIPGRAAAVLFADETEMLACLSLALSGPMRGQSWWSHAALRSIGCAPQLAGVWRARPAAVPAVLYYLARWDSAASVVSCLTPDEARTLLPAIAHAHDVPAIAAALSPAHPLKPSTAMAAERQQATPRAAPPWDALLAPATVPAAFDQAHAALLGVGLALHVRPAVVRSPAFGVALQRWWQAAGSAAGAGGSTETTYAAPPGVTVNNRLFQPALAREEQQVKSETPQRAGSVITNQDAADARSRLERVTQPARRDREHAAPAKSAGAGNGEPRAPARQGMQPRADSGTTVAVEPRCAPAAEDSEPSEVARGDIIAGGVHTEAGGVFYLINVMRALAIPECFEPGWGLASQLGPSAVLELLGRGLLGTVGDSLQGDTLWATLAELDGRAAATLPGARFARRGPGGLPSGWEPAPDDYLVIADDCPLLAESHPALQEWLGVALPPLGRQLQRALRLSRRGVAEALLAPGQLYVTRSHVDLVMALDAISLPVRHAGLDANPGWLPHFGRVVTFHFQ